MQGNRIGPMLVFAALLSGCGITEPTVGALNVGELQQGLDVDDISRVDLEISGTGILTPLSLELAGSPTSGWSGLVGDVPSGSDRVFTARAYDGATLIYEGIAAPVEVQEDTSLVAVFMQPTEAPLPFVNAAPRFSDLTASSQSVAPSGVVTLAATATDPDVGETLAYAWTAASGTFSTPNAATTTWTAPTTSGTETLQVSATDATGATATLQIAVDVTP